MFASLTTWIKKLFWPGPDFGTRDRFALRRFLLEGPEITTLDVGFGNGCMTFESARRGKRALGISILPHEVEKASSLRAAFALEPTRCEFACARFEALAQGQPEAYDQVVMFEVLEHIVDDAGALRAAHRLLKDRGQLHLTVPNMDSHVHFEPLNRHENGGHVRHGYARDRLEALLVAAGFDILDRRGVGGLGSVLGFKAVALARRPPGLLGQGLSLLAFVVSWPLVRVLNALPCQPWSLYVRACKR